VSDERCPTPRRTNTSLASLGRPPLNDRTLDATREEALVIRRCLFTVLLVCFVFVSPVLAFVPGDEVILSFPPAKLQKNEKIVGFEIIVTTGNIIAVDRIPEDWSLDLQAEISSKTTISGLSRHGAGALFAPSELPP